LGLFRSLRSTTFFNGIRINMLCPYSMDTPLIPTEARFMPAGSAMGNPEDVVEAGTRLMVDTRIVGRALVVGPKVKARLDKGCFTRESEIGKEIAIWEVYADDFEEVDAFAARFIKIVNLAHTARGWLGGLFDLAKAVVYPFVTFFRRTP